MATHERCIDFLRSTHLAVLSTVSKEGSPQSATLFFHVGDIVSPSDFRVYFVTRRDSRKFSNLLASPHPKVALVVGTELEPYSVQIEGTAEFIEASHGFDRLVELSKKLVTDPALAMLYLGNFYPKNPFGAIEGEEFAVFRITPTWVRFMHPDSKGEKIAYTTILS
jgi:general stress protein 26